MASGVKCVMAKSDTTPCFLRDGDVVEVKIYDRPCCVGCERPIWSIRLREHWLNFDGTLLCRMIDGRMGVLIIGPSDNAARQGNWRFGFQVKGEEEIRWRYATQLMFYDDKPGRMLVEVSS